jgi:hypothetical protein
MASLPSAPNTRIMPLAGSRSCVCSLPRSHPPLLLSLSSLTLAVPLPSQFAMLAASSAVSLRSIIALAALILRCARSDPALPPSFLTSHSSFLLPPILCMYALLPSTASATSSSPHPQLSALITSSSAASTSSTSSAISSLCPRSSSPPPSASSLRRL